MIVWHGKVVSENRRLLQGKGRWYPNPKYKAFKESLIWVLKAHWQGEPITGNFEVKLIVNIPKNIDMQNIIKPVIDAIEQAGIVTNDLNLVKLIMERTKDIQKDTVVYLIKRSIKNGNKK